MRRILVLLTAWALLAPMGIAEPISGHRYFPCRLCHARDPNPGLGRNQDLAVFTDLEERCLTCHTRTGGRAMDHPRTKSAGGRAQLSPELPSGPGGVISCATCHDPHPGNKSRFYLRDYNPRTNDWSNLCRRCHSDTGVR